MRISYSMGQGSKILSLFFFKWLEILSQVFFISQDCVFLSNKGQIFVFPSWSPVQLSVQIMEFWLDGSYLPLDLSSLFLRFNKFRFCLNVENTIVFLH